jgi:hypothetical protein
VNAYFRNSSINFEVVRDKNVYTLSIPVGVSYDESVEVIQQLKDHLITMKLEAEKREKEQPIEQDKQ